MSRFDPERAGWHLRDAVMRTAWQDLLAAICSDIQELRARGVPDQAPQWWSERLAPPAASYDGPDRSDQQIILALRCNLAAVETRFLHDLYEGKLVCWGRPGSSLAEYKRAPAWAVTGIESWWKGGGILLLQSGERFFAARVEPTNATKRRFSRSELRVWLHEHHAQRRACGTEPTERDDYEAAKQKCPGVSREVVREERQKLLPADLLRPGRRSAAGK